MNNELRTKKQLEFNNIFERNNRRGIIKASIRFGKTKLGVNVIKPNTTVLISYPKLTIKKAWEEEVKQCTVDCNITYSSFASLKKLVNLKLKYDLIIIDEIQKLSPAQKKLIIPLSKSNILGLTGTLRSKSELKLKEIGLNVIADYDLEDAINDGLVKDYRLKIHFINITNNQDIGYKNKYDKLKIAEIDMSDEILTDFQRQKAKWDYLKLRSWCTNFIYNSIDITNKVNQLIYENINNKTLIFSLRTEIANKLSDNTYHTKNVDKNTLEEFKISEKGHLSTVNMISEGVTIHNLNTIICHNITSNTEDFQQKIGRGLQLSDVNSELCTIHVVCLKDTAQVHWVELACKSLNQNKIIYVDDNVEISKIQYIKNQYLNTQLYLYNDSICYKTDDGYIFINDINKKCYSLSNNKLKLL